MRLEHVCDIALGYRDDFVLVRPYGGEEGAGYGELHGTATGERLAGLVRAVNHPRRRGDGAMLPDLHGLIETTDGARVLFSARGRTSFGSDRRGRQTLLFTFEAEDGRYRWLNDLLCIYEGIIEMPLGRGRVYACVNEL